MSTGIRNVAIAGPARTSSLAERFVHHPVTGFAPWIIYWVVADRPSTWLYGALAAALTAVILAISAAPGRLKILNMVTMLFFTVLTVAGMQWGVKDGDWMDSHSTALSSAVLAVLVLGSLLFVPFTEQYARETTPPEARRDPVFKRTHRVLTLMWGLTFAVIAVLGHVADIAPSTHTWTNWVIPAMLIVVAAMVTQIYPDRMHARAAGHHESRCVLSRSNPYKQVTTVPGDCQCRQATALL